MLDLSVERPATPTLPVRWRAELGGPIVAAHLSPDACDLAVALSDGPVVVLDAESGDVRARADGHAAGTLSLSWRADGEVFATSGFDGTAHLYDAREGTRLATLPAGARWVAKVAFESNGTRLATAAGKQLRLWDADGLLLNDWPERASTILDIAWRPVEAGAPALAATWYGAVALFEPQRERGHAREYRWQGSSLVLAWSPDAKYLATGDQDKSVHFWITKSGRDLQMSGYPRKVRELAWHHSSRFLATGGGHQPCIWRCGGRGPAGTTPQQLEFHDEPVSALAFEPAGDRLASGALDGSVALWEPRATDRLLATHDLGDEISHVVWLADDAFVATTLAGDIVCFQTNDAKESD